MKLVLKTISRIYSKMFDFEIWRWQTVRMQDLRYQNLKKYLKMRKCNAFKKLFTCIHFRKLKTFENEYFAFCKGICTTFMTYKTKNNYLTQTLCIHSYSPYFVLKVPFCIERNFKVKRGPISWRPTFFLFLNIYL